MIALVGPLTGALLRKEKDEASRPGPFPVGFLNAFVLRFVEQKAFLLLARFHGSTSIAFRSLWSLNRNRPRNHFARANLKDQ